MAVNTKTIKRRIKSVKNTKKITKAMEMVAAAKMRRAVDAAVNTRTYAQMAWDLLVELSKTEKADLPLLAVRPVKRILLIIITSNRGLCGSFNANIIKKTAEQLADPKQIATHNLADGGVIEPTDEIEIDVIGVGKKGADFCKKQGYNLIASYSDFPDTPRLADVQVVSRMALEAYAEEKYDKVVVAYTDYQSAIAQIARMRQVLPISEKDLEDMLVDLEKNEDTKAETKDTHEFLFEPSREEVLKTILPRLVETQLYQAVLESSASEHSARMMAMRNASDAANDMIKELSLAFNKARQAGITQEIAEIASGAAALE